MTAQDAQPGRDVQNGRDPAQRLGMLLAWHGSATEARMRRALSAAGLTPRHAMTLMHLEAGPVSQRALAERLEVDPSVLVGLLNDLEGGALVERRRDPADRRRHNVAITPAGSAALRTTDAALDAVEQVLFAGLSEPERDVLRDLLGRIDTNAEDFTCGE
ncbi:MarR family winged helix-turn-helix transcriptional regulator [Streptomyces sp. NBC_00536]|uniref:MarR family winged helix-turn-helix transcriptional regulator n=1 Tax=Streptomyces sp. NBC_00536 TaxID=2975769 RepID=UPI002E817343|nr:MarR family winged helix-turn-helix transcriptional regulator [Streptomyces sp. NBC_00536]WUC78902.1 MarR family winged helix-turn-helix transcriptional regulator [Streptomyces sp. NBC_00536]